MYFLLPQNQARWILSALCCTVALFDFLRLHVTGIKEAFIVFFGSFIRRHELTQLNGATYLLIGCMITSLLYSKEVVIAACIYVVVGDTFATIIGKNVESPTLFKQKTLLGSAGFLAGSCAAGLIFYVFTRFMPVPIILIGAVIATVLEALPIPLDDNFYVPIATGLIMSFL